MIKVYGIHNRTTAQIRINAGNGRSWLELEFKHGRLGLGSKNRAATYSTADKTEQAIIESSNQFGGLIKLLRVYDEAGENIAPVLATEKTNAVEIVPTEEPSVTTYDDAVALLKSKGAKATELRSHAAILSCAAKLGITFPNLPN